MSKRQRSNKETTTMKKRRAVGGAYIPVRSTNKRPYADHVYAQKPLPGNFVPTGAEIKAIDIALAAYNLKQPSVASNIILLNGIQAGTGFFNRVGARTEMKNLHIRGIIQNQATSVQESLARILIVYDRQPVGALPIIADILQSRSQVGTASTSGMSEINLDNRDRFVIIRDMEFFLPTCTNTAGVLTNGPAFPGDGTPFEINEFIKLRGLGTHYKSTSNPTTIADIATGSLYAAFVSEGTDATWTATVGFRLRYNDK